MYKLYLRRGLDSEDKFLVDPEKITLAAPNQGKGKNTIHIAVQNERNDVDILRRRMDASVLRIKALGRLKRLTASDRK